MASPASDFSWNVVVMLPGSLFLNLPGMRSISHRMLVSMMQMALIGHLRLLLR